MSRYNRTMRIAAGVAFLVGAALMFPAWRQAVASTAVTPAA